MSDAIDGRIHSTGSLPARPFIIGLVGASNIAMTRMLPAFAALGMGVRGPYDNEPRRFRYWAHSGVEGQTTNLDQLLASDIDAVYISTRNDQHMAEAVAAEQAGADYLVLEPVFFSHYAQDRSPLGPTVIRRIKRSVNLHLLDELPHTEPLFLMRARVEPHFRYRAVDEMA